MKVGIITINSAHNYGCMLQAWALQTYLEKKGMQADIINYRITAIDAVYEILPKKIRFQSPLLQSTYTALRKVKLHLAHHSAIVKRNKFENFINNKLNTTKVYTSLIDIQKELDGKYDALITGSDQVWNGTITRGLKPVYFLAFDTLGTKKIAYAPSIGKSALKDYEKAFFTKYLKEYQYLSVREKSAQDLLQPLTNNKIQVVLDPTLLLDRPDYEAIKKKTNRNGKYILVHIVNGDEEVRPIARKLSELTGLPIVHNRPNKKYANELKNFHATGPEEFLGLIENAEYVVTNSFHATVFSLIYERPFLTIPHKKYPERMENLLKTVGLESHLIRLKDELISPQDCNVDYTKVSQYMKIEKEKSRNYLDHALKS